MVEVMVGQSPDPGHEKLQLPCPSLRALALGSQPPCCEEAQQLHGKAMGGGTEAAVL